MLRLTRPKLTALAFYLLLAAPLSTLSSSASASDPLSGVADGKTPILTPEGTWIVPPPGAPLAIVANADEVVTEIDGTAWGISSLNSAFTSPTTPMLGTSCTDYRAGWYETNNYNLWGGHAGIKPQNLPVVTANYCAGTGMGYTDGVAFGGENSWIQDGLVTFPGELTAKWMCQVNNNGALTTRYGPANAYGNGVAVYTWFARDSGGVWRTYRYDTGPYSVELGCAITRGNTNGEPLQAFGEIQGATSTSAPMGPWTMFDLRYMDTANTWHTPSQLANALRPRHTVPTLRRGHDLERCVRRRLGVHETVPMRRILANETRTRTFARALTWRSSGVALAIGLAWYLTAAPLATSFREEEVLDDQLSGTPSIRPRGPLSQ